MKKIKILLLIVSILILGKITLFAYGVNDVPEDLKKQTYEILDKIYITKNEEFKDEIDYVKRLTSKMNYEIYTFITQKQAFIYPIFREDFLKNKDKQNPYFRATLFCMSYENPEKPTTEDQKFILQVLGDETEYQEVKKSAVIKISEKKIPGAGQYLIREYWNTRNNLYKNRIVDALYLNQIKEGYSVLKDAIQSNDENLRINAVQGIGNFRDWYNVNDYLKELYLTEKNKNGNTTFRCHILWTMGRSKRAEYFTFYKGIVENPENEDVKSAALEAIWRIDSPESLQYLKNYQQKLRENAPKPITQKSISGNINIQNIQTKKNPGGYLDYSIDRLLQGKEK